MVDTPDTRPAAFLQGMQLADGWVAIERVAAAPGATGGTFSVGYKAERRTPDGTSTGEYGFVKAIDYSKWRAFGPDPVSALPIMTDAFQFELLIVQECANRRMRNVVRGVSHGSVSVGAGLLPDVNYIVFEVADGDVRGHLDALSSFDAVWALRVTHNVANGLRQLHASTIFHQDIKPSNVLMFDAAPENERSKLGDLGRAFRPGHPAPHAGLPVQGDPVYAPPETLYGFSQADDVLNRLASDVYHLGSMAIFLFGRTGMSAALLSRLPPAFRPSLAGGSWGGTFEQVLPHLRVAFDAVMMTVQTSVASGISNDLADEVVSTVRQLCDPDPRLRGFSSSSPSSARRYDMERYVSRFDLLTRKSGIELRRSLS